MKHKVTCPGAAAGEHSRAPMGDGRPRCAVSKHKSSFLTVDEHAPVRLQTLPRYPRLRSLPAPRQRDSGRKGIYKHGEGKRVKAQGV